MMMCIALSSTAAWVYLVAFRGRFWRSSPVLNGRAPSRQLAVTAIVPARNEAEHIRRSLKSLLSQSYSGEFSVVLVDDNSTDGTREIAGSLVPSGNLSVIAGERLPPGWSGKLWAVHQGLTHPVALRADYLLLTDADIVHAPGHISALLAKAEMDELDLVSEMVRLNCATIPERALIPAFVFFFQMLYPFKWVADPRRRTAAAAGGTMLVSRLALEHIGGLSRIRNRLIDDCALAAEIKRSGGRIWLGHAEDTCSTRTYSGFGDIWNMIARTAYEQLGHSWLLLLGCVLGMLLIYCASPLLALFAHGVPRLLGMGGWLMMTAAFQPTLLRYRRSPLWGLALPLIALFYLGAAIDSARRYYSGRGGGWKDRVYPETPPT